MERPVRVCLGRNNAGAMLPHYVRPKKRRLRVEGGRREFRLNGVQALRERRLRDAECRCEFVETRLSGLLVVAASTAKIAASRCFVVSGEVVSRWVRSVLLSCRDVSRRRRTRSAAGCNCSTSSLMTLRSETYVSIRSESPSTSRVRGTHPIANRQSDTASATNCEHLAD